MGTVSKGKRVTATTLNTAKIDQEIFHYFTDVPPPPEPEPDPEAAKKKPTSSTARTTTGDRS